MKDIENIESLLKQLRDHGAEMVVFNEISAALADILEVLKAQPENGKAAAAATCEAIAAGIRQGIASIKVEAGPVTVNVSPTPIHYTPPAQPAPVVNVTVPPPAPRSASPMVFDAERTKTGFRITVNSQ